MAACTLQELKDWGVSGNDTQLQLALDDARRAVLRDGVAESHSEFSYLHRLRTVVELPVHLQQSFLAVSSRSVDGVSISYADSATFDSFSPMQRYIHALMAIVGSGRMIV